MQLETLSIFCKVYELRSFSAAARAQRVDPSAVSRRIKALEDRLGVVLFLRSTRTITPTTAGEDLYAHVSPALQSLGEAEHAVKAAQGELLGTIRVAAPNGLGRSRLAPVVHAFCHTNPGVQVELLLSDRHINLLAERIDLAIRPADPGAGGLVARRIGFSHQWTVAAPDYLARHTPLTSDLDTLIGHRVVLRISQGSVIDLREWLPEPLRTQIGVSFLSDDMGATADAILAGLGIGVIPEWLARSAVSSGELIRLRLGPDVPPAPVFAVLPSGRRTTARTRALLDALIQDWQEWTARADQETD